MRCASTTRRAILRSSEQLIASAKAQKADIITLHAHWGELSCIRTPRLWNTHTKARRNGGVDVIVGTHPHVSQPMEKYTYTQRRAAQLPDLLDFCQPPAEPRQPHHLCPALSGRLARGSWTAGRGPVTGLRDSACLHPDRGGRRGKLRCAPRSVFPTCWRTDRMQTAHTAIPSDWERADSSCLHEKVLMDPPPADHRELLVP